MGVLQLFKIFGGGLKKAWDNEEFRLITLLMIFVVAVGSVFYHHIEGWHRLDSAYFCVMTLTTIGLGDFVPLTSIGKIFTIIYSISGIGLFVIFLSQLATHVIENSKEYRSKWKNKRKSK